MSSPIEAAITELVQQAPALDAAVVAKLVTELRAVSGDAQPLAQTIARVLELVAAGKIDPGIALPALAMACSTLAGGLAGTLGKRELEASRYEIDTLLPLPAKPPNPTLAPDVPLTHLRRR